MKGHVLFRIVLILSVFVGFLEGSAKVCHKFIGYTGCSNYGRLVLDRFVNVWSALRCKLRCLSNAACETYFLSISGGCHIYRIGCLKGYDPNYQRFDLYECSNVASEPFNARVDVWDEQLPDLPSLYSWYSSGGHFTAPDETTFINLTFPYEVTEYGKRILRLRTSYKCFIDSNVTLQMNIRPAGIFNIVNLATDKTFVGTDVQVQQDGTMSAKSEASCATMEILRIEYIVATTSVQLRITTQVSVDKVNPGNFEMINQTSLVQEQTLKPIIVMNKDMVYESMNELAFLKPTISASHPVEAYWIFNGIRVSDSPCALIIDTRFNQSAYGLYVLYAENRYGAATFHIVVQPLLEEVFKVKTMAYEAGSRRRTTEVSHYFSGPEIRSMAIFSEKSKFSASLTDVRMVCEEGGQVKILQSNVSRLGGLTLSADITFESRAMNLSADIWCKTTYNYSLIANDDGYLGGRMSFAFAIADSILWIFEESTNIKANLSKATGNVLILVDDRTIDAQGGDCPYREPFYLTAKVVLEEGSNSSLHDVNFVLQIPPYSVDILNLNSVSPKCFCNNASLSKGMVKVYAKTLNHEEEIILQIKMEAKDNSLLRVPIWISNLYRVAQDSQHFEVHHQIVYLMPNKSIPLSVLNMSYIICETSDFFVFCTRFYGRRIGFCYATENQGTSWKALPSTVYDIHSYVPESRLLVATDALRTTIYVDLKVQPWSMYKGVARSASSTISATSLNESQLHQNELQNATTKIGSHYWMFTRYGIKENDVYILRW